jgi:hypothetical protein
LQENQGFEASATASRKEGPLLVPQTLATAKAHLAELIETARRAVGELESAPNKRDAEAVFDAVRATAQAAGFMEALTIVSPEAATEMLGELDSLVVLLDEIRKSRARAEHGSGSDSVAS